MFNLSPSSEPEVSLGKIQEVEGEPLTTKQVEYGSCWFDTETLASYLVLFNT